MAILIKGMEMPDSCFLCRFCRRQEYGEYIGEDTAWECVASKKRITDGQDLIATFKHPDCPLVEAAEVPDEQPDQNAQERYEDLCEYFKDCTDKGMGILGDRKEFKAWLERLHWHVVKCDELGRELEKLQFAQPEKRTDKRTETQACDCISIQEAIDAFMEGFKRIPTNSIRAKTVIEQLPSAQLEGWVKVPDTGIDDLSDGFHTFRQLYYQRMMLFATIVKQNREKAWKSLRHEDGELCFGGGWFIVGIDTPEGSYTYHYEVNYFSLFDCKELERGKHWDGHTEKDVTRLLSLPSAQPEPRWIPCSERLPEETRKSYWICTDAGYQCECRWTNINHLFTDLTMKWHWHIMDVPQYDSVVAWRPLPDPYGDEKDD